MDRLDAMQVMLTAVECGSLSKASRVLGQPLATVSRKVSELESYLKADLLIRSSRGLELTPAGRTYITAAKTMLEQLNEAERAAAGEYTEPKGDLVVTAPTMFGRLHVLPIVTAFLTTFPKVSVDLMLTDRVTHFLDDQVDVALRIGDLPDSSLIATRLGRSPPGDMRKPGLSRAARGAGRSAGSCRTRCDLLRERVVPHHLALLLGRERGRRISQFALVRQHHRRGDRCGRGRRGGDQDHVLPGCQLRA